MFETKIQLSKLFYFTRGFTRNDPPDQFRDDTAIQIRLTKTRPLLEAEYFYHKLTVFLNAVIGCKTSAETRRSHDYLQYKWHAYHCIAAFNGVIEPQQDGHLHWHMMIYSSVLSPELLQKTAIAPIKMQEQIAQCWCHRPWYIGGNISC